MNPTHQPATQVKAAPKNREDRFTEDLYKQLDAMGCFLWKMEKRRIRQAFERHYREVFSAVLDSHAALVDALKRYGGHDNECALQSDECTCGFTEALAAAEEKPRK